MDRGCIIKDIPQEITAVFDSLADDAMCVEVAGVGVEHRAGRCSVVLVFVKEVDGRVVPMAVRLEPFQWRDLIDDDGAIERMLREGGDCG